MSARAICPSVERLRKAVSRPVVEYALYSTFSSVLGVRAGAGDFNLAYYDKFYNDIYTI